MIEELPIEFATVPLPTPYRVGTVNCYILPEHPITVIDPGMMYEDSTDTLTAGLHDCGLTPEEVEVILVTHAHPDHYGAAGWLAEKADIPIHAVGPSCPSSPAATTWRR